MNNSQIINKKAVTIYNLLVHLCLFLGIMQIGCPIITHYLKFRLDWISIFALFFLSIYFLIKIGIKDFFNNIFIGIQKSKYLIYAIIAYLVWDTINFFYAKDPGFLINKYLYWIKIIAICSFVLLYIFPPWKNNREKAISYISYNLGITSVVMSLSALWGYVTGNFTIHKIIITPIPDHNTYATCILIGFSVSIFILIYNKSLNLISRIIICILIFVPDSILIYVSGSRRIIVMLGLNILFIIFLLSFRVIYSTKLRKKLVISIVLGICISAGAIGVYNNYIKPFDFAKTIEHTSNIDKIKVKGQGINAEVYVNSIADGSGLDLRKKIWKASYLWFEEMTPVQKVIGGGASYQSDVFNDRNAHINKDVVEHYKKIKTSKTRWMGPHNFILEDLLSGGIVKVLLDLFMIIMALLYLIKTVKYNKYIFVENLMLYAIVFANAMMGSRYGILGDQSTWLILTLVIINNGYYLERKE